MLMANVLQSTYLRIASNLGSGRALLNLIELNETDGAFYSAATRLEELARRQNDEGASKNLLLRAVTNYEADGLPLSFFNAAKLREEMGDYEGAIANYVRAESPGAGAVLAEKVGMTERSLELYELAIQDCESEGEWSDSPVWYQDAGRFCEKAGRLANQKGMEEEAREFSRRAIGNYRKGRAYIASIRLSRKIGDEGLTEKLYIEAMEHCSEPQDDARTAEEAGMAEEAEIYRELARRRGVLI
jgi:tetratricopeptide (TPR) repeat protein